MGWLRELMASAVPPIAGYGELARQALAHPEWPLDTQPRARSLAALFSKLDRGIELEWLAERDAAQRALALVLACPIETVRRAVTRDPTDAGHGFVRWLDVPYARPLALREESLPPGLPAAPWTSPGGWGRLWWVAPSGSGRSLVGLWLSARGLARHVCAERWTDAVDRLAGAGPLFLELERADDGLEHLDAALPAAGVCVAAPAPPPAVSTGGWTLVASPPLLDTLPALLAWLEARLPRDGAFDAGAAERWLRGPIAAGELPTLGAVLGAAGLLDARAVRDARGQTLAQLAEPFVNERLERANRDGAEARWFARHGFEALVRIASSALVSSDRPWDVARSLDDWIALVPPELRRSGSVSRRVPSAGSRASERPNEAEPGAFRIARALVDAGLLAERGAGRFALSPGYLGHALLECARRALVAEETPFAWGEALLRPHAAPAVLETLYEQLALDPAVIEPLTELDVSSQPSLVVATEAALVCLGLRALSGAEVPIELVVLLWNEQLGWLVELPGELPRPRLLCYAHQRVSPLARHAVWMLGLLAASELLGERQGRAHPLLRPWGLNAPPEALSAMLDAIYVELARPEIVERPWAVEAFALAGRLLDSEGEADELGADGSELDDAGRDDAGRDGDRRDGAEAARGDRRALSWHPLGRPARLVRALTDGDLDAAWLDGFGAHPLDLRALGAACELRQVAWSRMAHALWKTWQHRGYPAEADALFAPDSPHRELLWPHLPPEVLGVAWERWTRHPSWPFASFGAAQWSAFVDHLGERWSLAPGAPLWCTAFEHMGPELLMRAIDQAGLLATDAPAARALLERAWRRFPALLSSLLCERASGADAGAVAHLLDALPAPLDDELLQPFGEELSRRSTRREVIDAARAWLLAKVSARRGDWHRAYALFGELESRLARAERARGASASFG